MSLKPIAAAAVVGALALGGCGSTAPSYTDLYGYTCTVPQAFPSGYCPSDHGMRITVPAWMRDGTGKGCDFNLVNRKTGLCP